MLSSKEPTCCLETEVGARGPGGGSCPLVPFREEKQAIHLSSSKNVLMVFFAGMQLTLVKGGRRS